MPCPSSDIRDGAINYSQLSGCRYMKKNIWICVLLLFANMAAAQVAAPARPASNPFVLSAAQKDKLLADWPQLERYREENAALPPPGKGDKRVVFMGDSITDIWRGRDFFPGKHYINRGISGQTTGQMLIRFRADVIALKPRVVVILAGTNDIADNKGPYSLPMIEDNLISMAELARVNGIKVVLASITPVNDVYLPLTAGRPPEKIQALNAWIKAYARREHFIYLDYYDALVGPHDMLKKDFSADGIHPNPTGYAVMSPLAQRAIDKALMGP
ncbi:SGNH/GDSL hydrolase family protein [Rhodanobacter sp. C05]|uniref:SGNH/GDSL hydrolase family protein n=1 Tax=Rhodanobacter sp. C05 TaxID=1945855 RepID=UPI0020C32CA2|nr:SGNH/GDSL hydrolase family protein [Rhodanobacter sp. C05]